MTDNVSLFENMASTTINRYQKDLADNFTTNNELLKDLRKNGKIKGDDGGIAIFENLEYSNNGEAQRTSGASQWNLMSKPMATVASYQRKFMVVPITFTGAEKAANRGESKMIDLLKSKVGNAEKNMMNTLSNDIYSDGSLPNQIGGLQYLIADDPSSGTVAGIDRSTNSFWRNKVVSGALTTSNIKNAMREAYTKTKRNADAISAYYADDIMWNKYVSSIEENQRFVSTDGNGGFDPNRVKFMGRDVALDGGIGGNCPAKHMYAINNDYINFRTHDDYNFIRRGEVKSANADIWADAFMWGGALTMSNAELQCVIIDTSI